MQDAKYPRILSRIDMLVVNVSLVGWLTTCFFSPLSAQTCPPEKLLSKIAGIELELQPRLGYVRLHRVETLEDDVYVPRLGSGSVESPFHIYQVELRRFFLEDGEVRTQTTSGGGKYSMYVAISRDAEQVYRLGGFPNAEKDFNRLMSDYHIPAPRSTDQAELRAGYCGEVLFRVRPKQWFSGEEELLDLLAEHYRHRGEKDGYGQARRWWRTFKAKFPKKANLKTVITRTADEGYLVRFPLLWAPVEPWTEPEIQEMQIQVNQDGACHRVSGPQ